MFCSRTPARPTPACRRAVCARRLREREKLLLLGGGFTVSASGTPLRGIVGALCGAVHNINNYHLCHMCVSVYGVGGGKG